MQKSILLLVGLMLTVTTYSQSSKPFHPEKVLNRVAFLASDSLKGRKPGTPESGVAADYIRRQFLEAGLQPMGENGFQYFEVITAIEAGPGNHIQTGDSVYQVNQDFVPLPFSGNADIEKKAVFVGYGFDIENDTLIWNDYSAFDVEDKWVIILRGIPAIDHLQKAFGNSASERYKVMIAKDRGAAGVLFVSGTKFDSDDELIKMSYDRVAANTGIPVFHVKRYVVEPLFAALNDSIAHVEQQIAESEKPVSLFFNQTISARSEVMQKIARTKNVVAMIPGADPQLRQEYVVIGAHYDHLGLGGPGSGSRILDTIAIHYGADDNASGVAGVISLAEYFSLPANAPARSLVFAAFGAEEMGLIGSKYFVEHPLISIEDVVAMINFDMIGRLKESKVLSIGGTGTSLESEELLNSLANDNGLELLLAREGYGPSDHASFYSADIPVFFISTGAHQDYHTPADNVAAINASGMTQVISFTALLVDEIAARDKRLTFQEAGPKSRQRHGSRYKVALGIMPDFTDSKNEGLRVDAVRPDGPASIGGILKGDVIVAVNGKSVENIYDYMGRLKDLQAGQSVIVDVVRNGEKEILIIQL
jgi:aminopeptidase YwaD